MSNLTYFNVHNRFKINGFYLNRKNLITSAASLIKEGEEYEKEIGLFLLDWFDYKTDLLLQTSGTTNKPKIIKISKQAMINSALATGDYFNLKPGDSALSCLSTKYIAGKMMLVRAIILGLELDIIKPTNNPLEQANKLYSFVAMVPLQLENSIPFINNIKTLIVGGAKLSEILKKKLLKNSCNVFETYGATETVSHIAVKNIREKSFTLLPNITIKQDKRNCLIISAPYLFVNNLITNDIVELKSKKQFNWLGRYDNIINSGGIKLIPEQIEAKLSKKIKSNFFVTGVSDKILGEKLILVIEGKKTTFNQLLLKDLSIYEKPKEIRYLSKFITTETGKIKRIESLNTK